MKRIEHYQAAERLLDKATEVATGRQKVMDRDVTTIVAEALAAAQVHATLAAVPVNLSVRDA